MSKWISETKGLIWTLAGTGLVLITLSGQTQKTGIILSVAGLLVYGVLAAFDNDKSED